MNAIAPSRNALCACGSGRRAKHCCARLIASSESLARSRTHENQVAAAIQAKHAALDAQLANDLSRALDLYEQALITLPHDCDALHMRAVTLYQMGCLEEARSAFAALLEAHPEIPLVAWKNLGLTLSSLLYTPDDSDNTALRNRYANWHGEVREALETSHSLDVARPRVAVVVASYNHERFIEAALASVFTQTQLPDELIVIDDGSTDGSLEVVRRILEAAPLSMRTRLIARENRGAAATFNEAIAFCDCDWIAPLNSDDRLAPMRIEQMTRAAQRLAPFNVQWMFGGIRFIDANGDFLAPTANPRAIGIWQAHNSFRMSDGVGLSLLRANCTVSTGNQFFRRSLWQRIGGYRELRYNHDWDFALRATCISEPVFIDDAEYHYRLHESNTIAESATRPLDEAYALVRAFLNDANHAFENPFAPSEQRWGKLFWATLAGSGQLEFLSARHWQTLARCLRSPNPEGAGAGRESTAQGLQVRAELLEHA
jgi:glycosyltransferase involved in cell wall biosynthesis